MADLWLVACSVDDYGAVLRELHARDPRALVLRFSTVEALERLEHEVVGAQAGAALCSRGCAVEALERAVASLAARVGRVVVLTDALDAGYIARLFQAGAAEVIALGEEDAGAQPRRETGRAEVGARGDGFSSPGDAVRCVCAMSPADTGEMPPWEIPSGGPCSSSGPLSTGRDAEAALASLGSAGQAAPAEVVAGARAAVSVAGGRTAPVIVAVSGRGGIGKSTLVAAMACAAARMGLRAAMIDLDLMFGDLYELFGVDSAPDLGRLSLTADGALFDADIETTALRIGPGLTLWGPLAEPERAELMGPVCEQLIGVLRVVADVVLVDTSTFWGDAVGAAVAACNRCLVVGSALAPHAASAARVRDLAERLGVPKTKMTGVVMRCGAGAAEEGALRFEMGVGLRSKARVSDAGRDAGSLLSFGKVRDLMEGQGAFAGDVRDMTGRMLRELGCPVAWDADAEASREQARPRLRLPWKQGRGDA